MVGDGGRGVDLAEPDEESIVDEEVVAEELERAVVVAARLALAAEQRLDDVPLDLRDDAFEHRAVGRRELGEAAAELGVELLVPHLIVG